jgi:hypothetical protein
MTRAQGKLSIQIGPADLAAENQEIKNYRHAERGARPVPRRADIDPLEPRHHLPFLSLIEGLHGEAELDVRFRLIGTELTSRLERDNTGKTLREVFTPADPDLRHWILDACADVVKEKRSVLADGTLRAATKEFTLFQMLDLPLSEDGERVRMLLGRARFTIPEMRKKQTVPLRWCGAYDETAG